MLLYLHILETRNQFINVQWISEHLRWLVSVLFEVSVREILEQPVQENFFSRAWNISILLICNLLPPLIPV